MSNGEDKVHPIQWEPFELRSIYDSSGRKVGTSFVRPASWGTVPTTKHMVGVPASLVLPPGPIAWGSGPFIMRNGGEE